MGWLRLMKPWMLLYRTAVFENYTTSQILHLNHSVLDNSRKFSISITYSALKSKKSKKSDGMKEVNAAVTHNDNSKIQLFGLGNDIMAVLTKKQAKAQAEDRGLKLVEVDGNAKPYPVYQFMTGKELVKQQMEQRHQKKDKLAEKSFRLVSKISDHDLEIKLKQMKDNILKGHRVKLTVHAPKSTPPEDVGKEHSRMLKLVSEHLKETAIVGKASDTNKDLTVIFKPLNENSGGL